MTAREDAGRGRGRFKHDGDFERLCACGHALGLHTAAKVDGKRPCIAGDFGAAGHGCTCETFRVAPVVRRPVPACSEGGCGKPATLSVLLNSTERVYYCDATCVPLHRLDAVEPIATVAL